MTAANRSQRVTVTCVPGVVLAAAVMFPHMVEAQTVPDAGDVLRETTPPPHVVPPSPEMAPLPRTPSGVDIRPGGPSFTLKGLRFSGATVFSEDQLQTLAADRIGQAATLADLEAIAQRVSEKYRAAGYPLAQAIVPVQEVIDGVVEISVIEGRLNRVRLEVDPAAKLRPHVAERILAALEPGRPMHGARLERVMLLLSDLPGISPEAALEQSDEAGSTDLIVKIAPRRPWSLVADADNFGSRSSSEYRFGVIARLHGPLRLGDNLDGRLQLGAGGRLVYGRVGYELPLGGHGTRLGASYSRVEYELGKDFAELDSSGEADVYDLGLIHPFIRSRSRNLFGRLGWQQKDLEDRIGIIDETEHKTIRNGYAGFAYEQRDDLLGGGFTSAGLTAYFGDLDMNAAARTADRSGRRTEGGFQHWNYDLSRLNVLTRDINVFFGISGQFADKNLTSAEKVSLGGPRAVRAYAPSEATVDEGHVANLELRYSMSPELSLQGFYDWGWGKFNRKADVTDEDNDALLRGYGLGVFWGTADGLVLRASLAWRATGRGEADTDRVPRLYMQVSKSF